MAYTATITHATRYVAGKRVVVIKVVETEVAAASEWSSAGGAGITVVGGALEIPPSGVITHLQARLTSGTGTTIQPALGKAAGWSTSSIDHIGQMDLPAAVHNESREAAYTLDPGATTLRGRSTPDAGADNAVTTLITIRET